MSATPMAASRTVESRASSIAASAGCAEICMAVEQRGQRSLLDAQPVGRQRDRQAEAGNRDRAEHRPDGRLRINGEDQQPGERHAARVEDETGAEADQQDGPGRMRRRLGIGPVLIRGALHSPAEPGVHAAEWPDRAAAAATRPA